MFVTLGIHIGVIVVTIRSLNKKDAVKIVELMDAAIFKPDDQAALTSVPIEVFA